MSSSSSYYFESITSSSKTSSSSGTKPTITSTSISMSKEKTKDGKVNFKGEINIRNNKVKERKTFNNEIAMKKALTNKKMLTPK